MAWGIGGVAGGRTYGVGIGRCTQVCNCLINRPKQFVIPVFQRDYSWGPEQCDRMWSDVLKSADDDGQHFLGSFVYVDEQVGVAFGSWLVVDGQQRLTTLTLLMIALRDHLVEIQWSGSGVSVAQIDDFFLKNTHESGERRYRLALRRRDNDTLQALVDGKDPAEVRDNSEAIVAAYERFRALLRVPGVDPAGIYIWCLPSGGRGRKTGATGGQSAGDF